MLTFTFLYLIHYIFTFYFFFIFFLCLFQTTAPLTLPFTTLVKFIRQYTSSSIYFFIIILSLAGFPPFFLFYPKFMLLVEVSRQCIFHLQFLLIIFFFLITIFYLQFFYTTNKVIPLNKKILTYLKKNIFKKQYSFIVYTFIYILLYFSFFSFFSFIFFVDYYVITLNLL